MTYPILYESTETAFADNGQGILSDAISCTVTEELNGIFELEMQYPVSGIHYADIQLRSLILAQPNPTGDPQPFRVYRLTKPLDGVVTIYAQHLSYDLSGIPVQPFTAGSAAAAMAALKTYAVGANPFDFWTDKATVANMTVAVPSSIRALLGGVQGSVLDTYGGQYLFDRYTVCLYARRGADRGVTIRYGKNLTSLEQDANCASVYTGVYPYWADTEDQNLVQLPEKVLPAPGTYDFTRILPLDLSGEWQEPPTQDQLRQRAQRYMQDNAIGVPTVSLTVGFVPLEQSEEYADRALLERVDLGDTVTVQFARLGVDATAKVIQTVYDVLLERYSTVSLGDARASIADTIANQQHEIDNAVKTIPSMLQGAVDSATAQITGNAGGYVVLHSSTGGQQPDEILIMDTPSISTAKKIWRWNKAGLGYSSKGYNGPYGLAMTQDGAIVADYITTGQLTANLIAAGVLQSNDGKTFYLDLENGVLRMQAQSLQIGGKTVDTIASDKAQEAIDAQTQDDIFNVLTNNGQTQGIYLKEGKLYINATYMDTGTLDADKVKVKNLVAEKVSSYGPVLANGQQYQVYITNGSFYLYKWENNTSKLISSLSQYDGYAQLKVRNDKIGQHTEVSPGQIFIGRKEDGSNDYNGALYCGNVISKGIVCNYGTRTDFGNGVVGYPYTLSMNGTDSYVMFGIARTESTGTSMSKPFVRMMANDNNELEINCDYLTVGSVTKFKPKIIQYKGWDGTNKSDFVLAQA